MLGLYIKLQALDIVQMISHKITIKLSLLSSIMTTLIQKTGDLIEIAFLILKYIFNN